MRFARSAPAAALAVLAGCGYTPESMRTAPVVYSAEAARPAAAFAQCVRDRHLLQLDEPLEQATDPDSGTVYLTAASRDQWTINGGVFRWRMAVAPAGGGADVAVRSNDSLWGPFFDADRRALAEACRAG